jgi:hypothetical protein
VTPIPTAPEALVSAGKARDHFLDIAYSPTNRLERFNYTAGQEPLTISLIASDRTDTAFLLATIGDFNEASRTVKLSEKIIEEDSGANILITFLPESGLSTVGGKQVFTYSGKTVATIYGSKIYISSTVKGDARNHLIARGLYYRLGVTGETARYPDSLFYAAENTNTRLNIADKKAIAILYGPALGDGMTLEDLRKVMYFP